MMRGDNHDPLFTHHASRITHHASRITYHASSDYASLGATLTPFIHPTLKHGVETLG
jgi:hypothetical protein